MDIINQIEKEFKVVDHVRSKLFEPKLIQLHTGNEMFNSPEAYGVYKSTGGDALGVVGSRYSPMNLETMLDSIVYSIANCDVDVDLSTLRFREYLGGKKVAFTVDLPTKEIKGSPLVGDVISRRLEFRTGFDGLTKTSITEYLFRKVCENGATSPYSQVLSFKNTINNHMRIYNLCGHINQVILNGDKFLLNFGRLSSISMDSSDIDSFIKKVTGLSAKDYKTMTARSRNLLDAINRSVAIEMAETGDNLYSIVNGITRYNTHHKAKGDEEKLLYSSIDSVTQKAFSVALAQLN